MRPAQVWPAEAGRRFTGALALDAGDDLRRRGGPEGVRRGSRERQPQWSSRLGGHRRRRRAGLGRHRLRGELAARRHGSTRWTAAPAGASGARPPAPVGAPLALVGRRARGGDPAGRAARARSRHAGRRAGAGKLGVARIRGRSPADSGDVIVATVDSLFRLRDGRRQRPAPGARRPAPWSRRGSGIGGALVAGTADSLVVAIAPDDLRLRWRVPAGRPRARLARRRGRHPLRGEPPRHALPHPAGGLRPGAPADRGARLAHHRAGHGRGRPDPARWRRRVLRALRRDGSEAWRVQLAGPSSSARCRWTTVCSPSAATATCTGTADDARPRGRACCCSWPPAPARAQGAPDPLVKYGKWALAAGAVGMNYLAARAPRPGGRRSSTRSSRAASPTIPCASSTTRAATSMRTPRRCIRIAALRPPGPALALRRRDRPAGRRRDVRLGADPTHAQAGQHSVRAGGAEPAPGDGGGAADRVLRTAGMSLRPLVRPATLPTPPGTAPPPADTGPPPAPAAAGSPPAAAPDPRR